MVSKESVVTMAEKKIENDEAIKKLLILQLLVIGVPAELIASATGMNPNSIRNMFPLSKFNNRIKEIRKNLSSGEAEN